MSYNVFILRRAQAELAELPQIVYARVKNAVVSLGENPRPAGCRKLSGRNGWRIRVAQYRVIYEIDDADQRVTVLQIGHRRDIYR